MIMFIVLVCIITDGLFASLYIKCKPAKYYSFSIKVKRSIFLYIWSFNCEATWTKVLKYKYLHVVLESTCTGFQFRRLSVTVCASLEAWSLNNAKLWHNELQINTGDDSFSRRCCCGRVTTHQQDPRQTPESVLTPGPGSRSWAWVQVQGLQKV